MFTGLVQSLATVAAIVPEGPGVRLEIREPSFAMQATLGDSICVNGCCLTVVEITSDLVVFQAGRETLDRTNLGELKPGDQVNLERSLAAGDQLGGHYVTGHIDTLGTVEAREDDSEWATFWIQVPVSQIRQMASKGSVAIDGVSLTLVDVEDISATDDKPAAGRFSVALIPHTLAATTIGFRKVGDQVNIETDVLAKYVERQLKSQKLDSE